MYSLAPSANFETNRLLQQRSREEGKGGRREGHLVAGRRQRNFGPKQDRAKESGLNENALAFCFIYSEENLGLCG